MRFGRLLGGSERGTAAPKQTGKPKYIGYPSYNSSRICIRILRAAQHTDHGNRVDCVEPRGINKAQRIIVDVAVMSSARHEFIVRAGIFLRRFSG